MIKIKLKYAYICNHGIKSSKLMANVFLFNQYIQFSLHFLKAKLFNDYYLPVCLSFCPSVM